MTAAFTVYIPGLLGPLPTAAVAELDFSPWRVMGCALQHAATQSTPDHDLLKTLGRLFGVTPFPAAAARRFYHDKHINTDSLCCIDPVTIQTGATDIILQDYASLALSEVEAVELIDSLNQLFQDEHWAIEFSQPHHWYLCGHRHLEVDHPALHQMPGRSLRELVQYDSALAEVRRISNEIQIEFHQHKVNQQRHLVGKPPVNSVWLWGQGHLPTEAPAITWDVVYSDHDYILGYAQFCESQTQSLDALDRVSKEHAGHQLVVDTQLQDALTNFDLGAWYTGFSKRMTTIQTLLQQGQEVTLLTGRDSQYRMRQVPFWKRFGCKNLTSFLQ